VTRAKAAHIVVSAGEHPPEGGNDLTTRENESGIELFRHTIGDRESPVPRRGCLTPLSWRGSTTVDHTT
jgi:hypothetical protein